MDSLLATYASSDEEEESQQKHQEQKLSNKSDPSSRFTGNSTKSPKFSSVFSSIPPPKSSSSSLSFSLPPPKSNPPNHRPPQTLNHNHQGQGLKEDSTISAKSSSLFSVIPQPKSSALFSKLPEPKTKNSDSKTIANSSSSANPNPKKVVQFRPPINPSFFNYNNDDEDDDDDEEEQRRKSKKIESMTHTPTVKSFLSSIPAPKNSSALGALPNSSGTGRRSILEADLPASNSNSVSTVSEGIANSNVGNYDPQPIDGGSVEYTVGSANSSNWGSGSEHYAYYDNYGGGITSNAGSASEVYANYDSYGSYGNHGHYEDNWADVSNGISAVSASESLVKIPGKRGRSDIPQKIIEVKQDELIKNRPREDQTKLTGIAFGPSYQPVSTKGKPSKLHKRKHQIGSLYFDMRQKEMELAERRSKGFLTKAETQAKYGW